MHEHPMLSVPNLTCSLLLSGHMNDMAPALIDPQKGVDHLGVELPAPLLLDLSQGLGERPSFFVGAGVGEGVKGVRDRYDAGGEGYGLGSKTLGVALPIPALVVRGGDDPGHLEEVGLGPFQQLGPQRRVLAHRLPFFVPKTPALKKNPVGDGYLAQVVEGSGPGMTSDWFETPS